MIFHDNQLMDSQLLLNSKLLNSSSILQEYTTYFISYAITGKIKILHNIIKPKSKGYLSKEEIYIKKLERIGKILKCEKENGLGFKLYLDATERYVHKKRVYCNNRLCNVCSYKKAIKQAKTFTEIIRQYKNPRFMTISFKNITDLHDLKQYSNQFSLIRRELKRIGYAIKNYVAVLEITEKGKGYHPHYHMIYDGSYIPYQILKQVFIKISKGKSWHVNLEFIDKNQINSHRRAAYYVSKYLTKQSITMDHPKAFEYFTQTRGIRFVKIYGIRHKALKSYYDLYDYLSTHYEGEESLMYSQLYNNMTFYMLNVWDLTLTGEENYSKYFPLIL